MLPTRHPTLDTQRPMFQIYKTRISPFGGPVVMIVTGYKEGQHRLKGEVFCKFPAPHAENTRKVIRLDIFELEDAPFKLDAELMMEQAVEQGRMETLDHLDRFYKDKTALMLPSNGDLTKCDETILIRLQLTRDDGFLPYVANHTGDQDLRSKLDVLSMLPKITCL